MKENIEKSYYEHLLMVNKKQKEVPSKEEADQKIREIENKSRELIEHANSINRQLKSVFSNTSKNVYPFQSLTITPSVRSKIVYTPSRRDFLTLDNRLIEATQDNAEIQEYLTPRHKTPGHKTPTPLKESRKIDETKQNNDFFLTEPPKLMQITRAISTFRHAFKKPHARIRVLTFTPDRASYLIRQMPFKQYSAAFLKDKANQVMIVTYESDIIKSKLEKMNIIVQGGTNVYILLDLIHTRIF